MLDVLLPIGLAFIMFSLGLGLRIRDFVFAATRPQALILGLAAQIILLPLTAFIITQIFSLSAEMAIGLMILSACPGGVTAGIVTKLARGETALSISLTALTSLFAFVSVPIIIATSYWYFSGAETQVSIPVGQLAGGLIVVTLIPVCLGLLIAEKFKPRKSVKLWIDRSATGIFGFIVIYTFVNQWTKISDNILIIGPACLLLNLLTMSTGALLAKASKLSVKQAVALSMECGIQNSALGITLAITVMTQPELAVPSVVYAFIMNITALTVIAMRRIYG